MDNDMTKPAYVTVVFRNRGVEGQEVTVEGWLTMNTRAPDTEEKTSFAFVTPSLDYDENTLKISMYFKDIVSITPAQSIREYKTYDVPYAGIYAVDSNGITRAVHPDELRATNLG